MKTSDAKMSGATSITLPKSTPGVAELVSSWEDGGEYHLTVRQVTSDDKGVTLEFEPMDVESEETDEPAEIPPSPPKTTTKPAVKVRY